MTSCQSCQVFPILVKCHNSEEIPLLHLSNIGDQVSQFLRNFFVASLFCAGKVKAACNLGKFELTSKMGLCQIVLKPRTGDVGSEGEARGKGTWINIWNLPLYCQCCQVLVDLLNPISELAAISKDVFSNKEFLGILIYLRNLATFPHEIELSIARWNETFCGPLYGHDKSMANFRQDLDEYVIEPGTVEVTNVR